MDLIKIVAGLPGDIEDIILEGNTVFFTCNFEFCWKGRFKVTYREDFTFVNCYVQQLVNDKWVENVNAFEIKDKLLNSWVKQYSNLDKKRKT